MLIRDERTAVSIEPRYAGLPRLALGGYSSGLVAAAIGTSGAEVHLRRPVPLSRSLSLLHTNDGRVELRDGEMLLAEGAPTDLAIEVPHAPTLEQARAASQRYPGFHGHPYPACFACGPEREDGDGLRLFPGSLADRRLVAAPWTPPGHTTGDDSVRTELVWAAFDCAQLWALMVDEPGNPGDRAVTAALAGAFERPVRPGLPHVVIAWTLGRDGDKLQAGAALIGSDGDLCAVGLQTAVIAKWGVPLDFTRRRASEARRH
jgi:hypothetical protein